MTDERAAGVDRLLVEIGADCEAAMATADDPRSPNQRLSDVRRPGTAGQPGPPHRAGVGAVRQRCVGERRGKRPSKRSTNSRKYLS